MKYLNDVLLYIKEIFKWLCRHNLFKGINVEYEQIKVEIFKNDLMLDFEEIYTYVQCDVIHITSLNGQPDYS